jgi:hypothetical protein
MVCTRRWVGLGVAACAALSSASTPASARERPSIVVYVDNRAAVPPHDIARAQLELTSVFHAAGVEIEWSNTGLVGALLGTRATPRRRQVVVMVVNAGRDEPRHASGCPLGYALPSGGIAYVFYNRIVTLSRSQPVDVDLTLGRVIAHEVGHLLLPAGRHPNYGIMRATLDLAVKNPNRFTDDEAQKMQDGLARSREP